MFGGTLDIDFFRTVKSVHQIHSPPFVSHIMIVEERQPIASIGEEKNIRGLKRPTTAPPLIQDPSAGKGLYEDFLAKKTVPPPPKEPSSQPQTKKTGLNKYAK